MVMNNSLPEKVQIVAYRKEWPHLFAEEAKCIQRALGDNCVAIHHVGSTAIPDLSAKPIIDIIPVVKDILGVKESLPAMKQLGYESRGEFGMLFRHYFVKGRECRTFNVHVFEESNPEVDRHIKFRDWMRSHADDREAYQKLKTELALKFPNDIMSYCFGKDAICC